MNAATRTTGGKTEVPMILCIDEEASSRMLEETMTRIGHRARHVSSLAEGLRAVDREPVDLVISCSHLPDGTGSDLVKRLRGEGHRVPVILLAGESAIQGIDLPAGASGVDVLRGPAAHAGLREAVDRALLACGFRPSAGGALTAGESRFVIGGSRVLRQVLETVRTVAPTRATVLIEGESGTGKELLVRALHHMSPRATKPFIAVNCAALPDGLVESTLFGHERGSFTGATGRFVGAFERAHTGTLLLDEISELRLDLQAKLLRAIQEKQFERVGGAKPVEVDVRLVATTNRDLREEVQAGRFRGDLYYRLRVVPILVPPLRARREDVPLLVQYFVERVSTDLGIVSPEVPEETLHALAQRPWPGNVRELEHAVERAVILNQEGPLRPGDFALTDDLPDLSPAAVAGLGAEGDLLSDGELNLRVLERRAIERALRATGGHRIRAAGLLGISDRTLRNKLNGTDRLAA